MSNLRELTRNSLWCMKSWRLRELGIRRSVFCALCNFECECSRLCFEIKRDETRLSKQAVISTFMSYQTSECSRYVLLIILLSDFRIINVLVLPTNQKPLLQWIHVTRCALSPFTSFENCSVWSQFQYGFTLYSVFK